MVFTFFPWAYILPWVLRVFPLSGEQEVAETMLPEAYEQGGSVVGMSTLFGFLSCLMIKSLEQL